MTTAYALMRSGTPCRGEWKEHPLAKQKELTELWFIDHDVMPSRPVLWAKGVAGARLKDSGEIPLTCGAFTLDSYQRDALGHLTVAGGLLGMAPGLGKTVTATAAAVEYATRNPYCKARCWIIAPLNAMSVWTRWLPLLKEHFHDVRVLSRDSLHKYRQAENSGGVLIFDEIHGNRHTTAQRTAQAHTLRSVFDIGIGLTGTVLHGGVEGVLSMLDLCVPGAALFANRWTAGEHFGCLVRKNIGTRRVTSLEQPSGERRDQFMEYLTFYATMLSFKSEVVRNAIDVPEQTVETVKIGGPWRPLHEEAADLALAIRDETGELPHAQKVAHALCAAGVEAKLDWLEESWDDRSIPLVLFANYTATLDAAAEWLTELKVSFVRVDGSVLGPARAECVRRFQAGEVTVFLGQIGAAGVAVDLFRAHISVALDHSWKGDEYAQALARTARRGQLHHCRHFDLVANSLQARVVERVQSAEDFNAQCVAYAELKNSLLTLE